ncbi:hypothetical protein IMSAG192_01537 [Muribaculaceae bacterium]|nr:hypothetical protein IMSAG192_01537 [Muribaculaceae bacterium]
MISINPLTTMWHNSSATVRLIIVNTGIFALIILGRLVASLCNSGIMVELMPLIECPDSMLMLASRPWTLLTYMFVHADLFHLIFNMLWLYWFGSVFMLTGISRQIYFLYIAGGIAGALMFVAVGTTPPWHSYGLLAGSSASVMAVVTATTVLHPDYRWNMIIFGEVAIKWVAVITIVIAMLGDGSRIAHIGGASAGIIYAVVLTRGRDLSAFLSRYNCHRKNAKSSTSGFNKASGGSRTNEEQLDEILDKVRRSGYASLSSSEKKRLIDISRHTKDNV